VLIHRVSKRASFGLLYSFHVQESILSGKVKQSVVSVRPSVRLSQFHILNRLTLILYVWIMIHDLAWD